MFHHSCWQRITLFLVSILTVVLMQICNTPLSQPLQTQTLKAVSANCRIVQHESGKSCIPVDPQRIVAMDQDSLEILVALGLKPIATTRANRTGNKTAILSKTVDSIIDLGKDGQPNLERIVRLNPDLIVGMFFDPQNYKLFSEIAPTIQIEFGHAEWKKTLQQFGEVLNKNKEAEKLLDAYQKKVESLKSIVKQKLGNIKVSIMRFYTTLEFTEILNHVSFPGSVIEELEFVNIPTIQRQSKGADETSVMVSLERVDWLEANAIFVALDPGAERNFQTYVNNPLWKTLKAAKNQHIYMVNSGHWVFGNILSANAILDDLFKYLVEEKVHSTEKI